MQKKQCPNGHVYDPSIYGDQCPLCPPPGQAAAAPAAPADPLATRVGGAPAAPAGDGHTVVAAPHTGVNPAPAPNAASADPAGATKMRPREAEPAGQHTVIRHAGARQGMAPARRLVGFLVSYNRDPNGRAYNLYEGRNFIGRDSSCDICVPEDAQMSGRHLSILYRNVDKKFKFRDEQSSNGTFINAQLTDDGELENYDIIRAGSTIFILIMVPDISNP